MDKASGVLEREIKGLTHSQHPNLKILAAQNIRIFFSDFPEFEEEAINAVYDLCEDQTPAVRIEGYTAVTHLSKADSRLVRRNADVLLQLLQSDEPDEAQIVKNALREHLEMDSKVTLSVLCDQISPLEDSMDEEEQDIRDRLRKVVLKFLTEDARTAIVEQYALPGSGAEETLFDTLFTVIPKLAYKDVEIIVEELLLKLKAFRMPFNSPRGSKLLALLLNKVTGSIQNATITSLRSIQPYLDLASFVVVEKRVAPAIELLRPYCLLISTKMNLHKFRPDHQQLIVCRLAETFQAANEQFSPSRDDGDPPLDTLSRSIVDSCPFLLARQETSPWTPRPHLVAVLSNIQKKFTREQSQDIYNLIRLLVPPPSTPKTLQNQNPPIASTSQTMANGKGLPAFLPDRPVTGYPARRMHIASNSRPQGHNSASGELFSTQASQPIPAKRQLVPESSSRPPKRQKSITDDGEDTSPSLLSRMGTTFSNAPTPRTNLAPTAPPRTTAQRSHVTGAPDHLIASGELSIKGAANMGGRNAGHPSSWKPEPVRTPSFSLLERLENPTAGVEDGRSGPWPRRNSGR
ncbi:hypothetical protein DXG01_000875 [Tephrocybe rancida]|nr:hypothetical protein DXG01_000875 [Tephrocybe rancida]